jgi:hypothetical protein
MSTSRSSDPERELERNAAEMEERLHRLEDHIDEAEQQAETHREDAAGELPTGAQPPEGGDAPPTVEGRRDGDDEGSSAQ